MKPACTDLQIKERLGLSWRNLRRLRKVAPWPDAPIDSLEFEQWATRGHSGLLIHNMRVYKPTPTLILDNPQHSEPISLHDALRRLGRKSPAYNNAMLGKDSADNFAIVGCNGLYVPLGNWSQANRWFLAKQREQKAA